MPLTGAVPEQDDQYAERELQLAFQVSYSCPLPHQIEVLHEAATPDPCLIPSHREGYLLFKDIFAHSLHLLRQRLLARHCTHPPRSQLFPYSSPFLP
jgi:hypothetical protein